MIRYCTELQSVQYLNPHVVSIQEEEHNEKREHGSLKKNCKTGAGVLWHMFEWPLGQFRDIHIPLMMLLQGKWGTEKAILFLKELRENGFVENKKYNLFPDV